MTRNIPDMVLYSIKKIIDSNTEENCKEKEMIKQWLVEEKEYHVVTRIHKEDLRSSYLDNPEILEVIDNLSYEDMDMIVRKMADVYDWEEPMKTIFEERFLNTMEK
jgi:hypothetical protein